MELDDYMIERLMQGLNTANPGRSIAGAQGSCIRS
jgi:hypothetical protein